MPGTGCTVHVLRPDNKTPAPALRRLVVLYVLSAAARLGPGSLRGFVRGSKCQMGCARVVCAVWLPSWLLPSRCHPDWKNGHK